MESFLFPRLSTFHPALGIVDRAVKWTVRQVTGTTELERLLANEQVSSVQALQLDALFMRSLQLESVYKQLSTFASDSSTDAVISGILQSKPHLQADRVAQGTPVGDRLRTSLDRLGNINDCGQVVASHLGSKQPYSRDNADHEAMLERLWALLMPTTEREARMTSQWGDIGFQGKDPATDFRGMGILGLMNLVYLAETYPKTTQRMLLQSRVVYDYSFAITGINLTGFVVDLLRRRTGVVVNDLVTAKPGSKDEDLLRVFHEKYCSVFLAFHHRWQQSKPENIMSFGPVFEQFKKDVENEVIVLAPVDDSRFDDIVYFKE